MSLPSETWLLVRADVLPDVFAAVLAAQNDLASGKVRSVSEAARLHGISRSAYYKYRGAIAPYVGKATTTMTVELLLQDCPGVLSCVLSAFAKAGANILTVNQQAPSGGKAQVTLSARTESMSTPIDTFIDQLGHIAGVQYVISVNRAPSGALAQPKGEVL